MNKNTADRMQFVGRVGNHSTKASARGANLLGWGEAEKLSPEDQRKAMAARVKQIDDALRENRAMPKPHRSVLIAEKIDLQERMHSIRPTRRAPNVQNYFIDVARGRLTKAEFDIWMGEAVKRMEQEEGQLPTAQESSHA